MAAVLDADEMVGHPLGVVPRLVRNDSRRSEERNDHGTVAVCAVRGSPVLDLPRICFAPLPLPHEDLELLVKFQSILNCHC